MINGFSRFNVNCIFYGTYYDQVSCIAMHGKVLIAGRKS